MSSDRCCGSLGFLLLLLLAGTSLGVLVKIPQGSVSGTVGQSVLLPVSYRCDGASDFPLTVIWAFRNHSDPFMYCTVLSCILDAGEVPHNCSAKCIHSITSHSTTSRGCFKLFPENGSLLLHDLHFSDSGTYSVTFKPPHQTRMVTLMVHEQPPPPRHPGPVGTNHDRYYIIGICSLASLLLLLLLLFCIWRRGAAWQQKRRIIKVQQVSSVEEAPVEGPVVTDVATIYTTVGDSFEQPPPRVTPEAVYSSVSSPRF